MSCASAIVALSAGCVSRNPAEDAFARAEKLRAANLVTDAKLVYEDAIKANPDYAPPYRALAEIAAANKDNAAAIAYWTDYLKRKPDAVHGWCQRAQAEMLSGLEVAALKDANEELKRDPNCTRAHLFAGLLYARASNAGQALPHLKKAAEASPDKPPIQLAYGRVLALAQQYDEAEKVLIPLLKARAGYAEPYYWLGYVYARRSPDAASARRAEELLRRALSLDPNLPEANYELGRLLTRERRSAEAIPLLRRAADAKGVDPAPLFSLSEAYQQLGKGAEADAARAAFKKRSDVATRRKALLRQYAVNPKEVAVNLALWRIERERGDAAGAALFLRSAQSFAPDDGRVLTAVAEASKNGEKSPAVVSP